MTTNYDPIADQYKRSKQQPWRTFIESHSFLNLIGDLSGRSVLDLACGEGFYTRQFKQRGANLVTGLDLSAGMIELAHQQEEVNRLGIEYVVADARTYRPAAKFDLVVAAYLLNYATNQAELQAMCDGIASCLKPGGRFLTVNSSPLLNFSAAPSYRKYGFETSVVGTWQENAPVTWKFYLSDGCFEIENYYLSAESHEAAFRHAGFQQIHWHKPQISSAAFESNDQTYWADFMEQSPITLIECVM